MTGMDKREKDFENKFAHDEELKFKVAARRRKLLGLWAGEKMGFSEEESLKYALEIVQYGIEHQEPSAVINKILADAEFKKFESFEGELRQKNNEFEVLATRQIKEQG